MAFRPVLPMTPVDHAYGRLEWVEKDRELLRVRWGEAHGAAHGHSGH